MSKKRRAYILESGRASAFPASVTSAIEAASAATMVHRPPQPTTSMSCEFNNMVTPYTDRLFNEMVAQGEPFAVVSCVARERNRSWAVPSAAAYNHVVLPGIEFEVAPRRIAHLNGRIFRTFGALKPAVLVVTGFYPSMVAGWLWARATRTPIALRIDGGADDLPQSIYHRLVRPLMLRSCTAVLTCGRKGRDFFRSAGFDDDQLFTMPLVPAWSAPATVPDLSDREFDLLWVAEMHREVKNTDFFAGVAATLAKRRPGLRVMLVGDGKDADAMLARLRGASVAFEHHPVVQGDDMPAIYAAARLLLLPSLKEPWGLVCNEAMQCGTVCLVSPHVGAADDLVLDGRNGRVLPLVQAIWADAADEVLDDVAAWTRLSTAGRAAVAERSLAKAASIYRDMLGYVRCARTTRLQ